MARKPTKEVQTERLVRDYKLLNDRIEDAMDTAAALSREKAEKLLELRETYSVAEIAALLGVTRQAVYNILQRYESSVYPGIVP